MPDGDGAAVHVDLAQVGACVGRPAEHHGRERLVHLEQVDVRQLQPRLAKHLLGGRDDAGQHVERIGSDHRGRVDARQRPQPEAVGGLAAGDHHGGAAVGQRRRVAGRDLPVDLGETRRVGLVVERGAQAREGLDGGAGPHDLIGAQTGQGSQLVVEQAGLGGGRRLLVAARREFVELGAGQLPFRGDQFGADTLRDKAFGIPGGHVEAERVAAGQYRRAHRHPRHGLHARRDDDVVGASQDTLGGEADGLLAAAALTVHGGAGHGLGETRSEQRVAGDVHGLVAHLGDGAGDHVVDLDRVDAGARHQLTQAVREQIGGQHAVQCAVGLALADRCAYRTHDDRVAT